MMSREGRNATGAADVGQKDDASGPSRHPISQFGIPSPKQVVGPSVSGLA
jgi:hypothetical protein